MPRRQPHPYQVTITRHVDAQGRRCKATDAGARKVTEKSQTYYADLPGRPRVPLGTDLEDVAWKQLRDMLQQQHERDLGIRDEFSDHARVLLAEHLARWIEVLAAKGGGERHTGMVRGRMERLFALANWRKLAHITADGALLALAALQKEAPPRGPRQGRSAQTRNHYLIHLRAFCTWCVASGRLKANPVATVAKVNVESDRRHQRRAPTAEEVAELLRHLASPTAPIRLGMTGMQRALAYQLCMATGFRAGELRALTRESFDLDAAVVTVPAAYSKRRRADTQPLPPWLVEGLRGWFAQGGGCWERFPAQFPGRLLKADLHLARKEWIDASQNPNEVAARERSNFLSASQAAPDGTKFWDMHSLRVAYITELAHQPGMSLKTLMTLARHSTPQLSLSVYAKVREDELRAAVDRLPAPEK